MVEISPIFGRGPRISASAYTGRAVAPMAVDGGAETRTLITKNSLQLGIVANQIQGLTAQMQSLSGSLSVIASNLSAAQTLQRQKDEQELELENRLAQQKLREGKESVIEKKIQAAALAPAQKLASRAQFTLGRLQNFFISIFGGWLLNQGVQTLKALSEGNRDKLNEIALNVTKNLAIISGIYVGIKLGIAAILGTFSVLGVKLLALAAIGLFTKPGRQLIQFVADAAQIAANAIANFLGQESPFPNAGKLNENAETDDTPIKAPTDEGNETNIEGNQSSPEIEQNTPPDQPAPEIEKPNQPKPDIKTDTGKGNLSENLEGKGGPSSSIESLQNSANLSANIATDIMTSLVPKDDKTEGPEPPGPTKEAESGLVKMTADFGSGEVDLNKPVGSEGKIDKKVLDPETTEYIEQEKYIGKYGKLPPSMLESMGKNKQVAQRVSQPPAEPPVNVLPIPVSSGSSKPQEPAPVAGGIIGKVENYATRNEDNMYTLGAMSNFNVIGV